MLISVECLCDDGYVFTVPLDTINNVLTSHLEFEYNEIIYVIPKDENILNSPSNIMELETNQTEQKVDIKQEGKKFEWNYAATKCLLNAYIEKKPLVPKKIKSMKILWNEIAKVLIENECLVTSTQVQDKFRALVKIYKKCLTKKKKTGHNYITCDFFEELSDIFRGKVNIEPIILSGNIGTQIRDNDNQAQNITEAGPSTDNKLNETEEIAFEDSTNDATLASSTSEHSTSSENKISGFEKKNVSDYQQQHQLC